MSAFASAAGSPIIEPDALAEHVLDDFGISLDSMAQVFGGQDSDAAVLHAVTGDGLPVAVKVSRNNRVGGLLAVALLAADIPAGIPAPLLARSGKPYSVLGDRRISLTPWIAGATAYEAGMTADQWRAFGALLSRVHATPVPDAIAAELPAEDFRTPAAALARDMDERIREPAASGNPAGLHDSPTCRALIQEWRTARQCLTKILAHIDDLGDELRSRSTPSVLCHGDAHISNVLLDRSDDVWLLDWDEVVLAPRERDLMFIIEGVLADALVTAQQQAWFFDGYGPADVDPMHLAYYRCSWAVQDVADFASRILTRPDGNSPEDWQGLRFFRSVVSPTGIVGLAVRSLREIGRVS
ncbi:MAG: phosphotransferase [Actinomycetota bacterium]|nr:phosphotransferase [Actinomycetota bacterium]